MTIDNSLLDINNISVVQIVWDDIQEKPILAFSTINSDYNNAGNIGIGVSNPISKFDVNGTINALDFSKKGLNLSNIFITSNIFSNESINFIPRTTNPITKLGNTIGLNYDINTLTIINSNLTVLNTSKWITSNSNIYINNYNVGIGTSNPNPLYKLDINGIINATDIYINNNSINYFYSNLTSNNSNYFENKINSISLNYNIISSNIEINNYNNKTALVIKQWNSNYNLAEYYNSNKTTFIITSNSNIGIGINNPNQLYKLDVGGFINANDIYINNTSVNTRINNNFTVLNNFIENTNNNFLNMITSINNINNSEKSSLIVRQTNSNKNVAEFYNSNNSAFIINSNLNIGIGTTNPLYTLDVNGTINCSSLITNGYNMNFIKNFYFLPVLNSGSYEFIFDIRNYISNSVGNDIRCFNIYGHSSNGDFNNSSIFSGAYIFFISGFNNGTGKKVILNETGGTINYIPQYQLKYSSSTSSNGVYMTIQRHN